MGRDGFNRGRGDICVSNPLARRKIEQDELGDQGPVRVGKTVFPGLPRADTHVNGPFALFWGVHRG